MFVQRGSLLSVDGNNAREIRVYFQGADLTSLMDSARVAEDEIPKTIPNAFPQTFPGLELNQPELQLIPDEWRIARSGLTRTEVAASVRAFTGGLWAGEYFDGNERLDIIVKANEWRTPEELAELPIVTPTSGVQTVGELAEHPPDRRSLAARAHQRAPHRQRQFRAARGHDARRGARAAQDRRRAEGARSDGPEDPADLRRVRERPARGARRDGAELRCSRC